MSQFPQPGRWPLGSRLLQLRPQAKIPYGGSSGHAHLGAVLDADFVPVGRNIGIVLDAMYIAVDIDQPSDPVAQQWIEQMLSLGTWQQATPRQHASAAERAQTPRGAHWLVAVPPGWTGSNAKIHGAQGQEVGDVKSRGYIVAPGSAIMCDDGVERGYEIVNPHYPVPAPPWLLTFASGAQGQRSPVEAPQGAYAAERDAVPTGSHDDFLASLGAFLRTRHGFSEAGLRTAIESVVKSGLLADVDPRRPYTEHDVARIARSCVNLGAQVIDAGPLMPSAWHSGGQIQLVQEPTEWWVRGFFPKGRPIALYGKKGQGKSTLGSYVASLVTAAGATIAPILVEETNQDFLWRAILAGADRDKILFPSNAGQIQLPRDAVALQQVLELAKVDVVWFDSVFSHFGPTPGMNAAERARACLTPLADICHKTGKTVIYVFHEKKEADTYLGSVEMVNIARHVIRATRIMDGPMYLDVTESNLRKPDHRLAFGVNFVPAVDPLSGGVQLERLDDGTLVPLEIGVPQLIGKHALIHEMPIEVELDDQKLWSSKRGLNGRFD